MTERAIIAFRGAYSFLGNFYPSVVLFDGELYPTVEHAFQAAKTYDDFERHVIRLVGPPAQAKRRGRQVSLVPGWNFKRDGVMYDLVATKFSVHHDLRDRLLNTGNAHLQEGNTWGDRYWGTADGVGENKLGQILMDVRSELRRAHA